MVELPSPSKKRAFWATKWFLELSAGLAGLAVIVVGILHFFESAASGESTVTEISNWRFGLTIIAGVLTVIAFSSKLLQAKMVDEAEEATTDLGGFQGCLHVLYSSVKADYEVDEGTEAVELVREDFRVTLYAVRNVEQESDGTLEQITRYVGGTGGKPGRILRIQTGIIGKAVRAREPQFAIREVQDFAEWQKVLVSDWGFTAEEAQGARSDRWSFIAVPIQSNEGLVVGVVFADSKYSDMFTSERRQSLIIEAVGGITAYLESRSIG